MNEMNDAILLELDRTYELRCTHSVLKHFSRRTGLSMTELVDGILRYDVAAVMMYCMMQRVNPALTEDDADALLDRIGPSEVVALVSEAMAAAFPPPADVTETPRTAAGTGKRA